MTELKGYHAHVYYDAATKPVAERLRETIVGKFAVTPGAFSDEARGPERRSESGPVQATTCSTLADARRRQEHCWSIQPVRAIPITGRTLRDGPCGVNELTA